MGRKKKETELQSYIATGDVTLSGVTFFIEAESLEAAEAAFSNGECDSYDTSGASTTDVTIDGNVEPNF